MALAALPLAEKLLGTAGKAVKADLVVIGGQWFREVRVRMPAKNKQGWKWTKQLVPVDLEFHVNPVSIGLGVLGTAVAAGAAWFVWNGLEIHSGLGNVTVFHGFKDTITGQNFLKYLEARRLDAVAEDIDREINRRKKECQALGGTWDQAQNVCVLPDDPADTGGGSTCGQLYKAFAAFRDGGDQGSSYRVKEAARAKGCAWAQ